MNNELLDFTRQSLQRGVAREEIAAALRQAGWAAADVAGALRAFAAVDFPVPVPRPKPSLSAREVFVYLVMFTALYVTAYNLGSLLFDFVDRAFPDPLVTHFGFRSFYDNLRANVSALVIAFPLFLFCFRATTRSIALDPTRRHSWPRKWLTYLTMFGAVTAVAGDLGVLVYNLLGGELSARFLLKVSIVAVIAGGAFLYFLRDMRQDEREATTP